MSAALQPSLLLRSRSIAHPVAYTARGAVTVAQCDADITGLADAVRQNEASSWGIRCDDAYYFLCALLAVLSCGRRAVIPPNFLDETLASMSNDVEMWIADETISYRHLKPHGNVARDPFLPITIAPNAVVDIFTSGTTGTAKSIRKQFSQFTVEADVLEQTWGGRLGSATVVGTVPHHHLYGLLFRLLWPFQAGRPFDADVCGDPNELVQHVNRYDKAVVVSSPAQLGRLPELTDPERLRLHTVMIFSSGGPLSPKAAKAFTSVFTEAPTEVYGSSETGGIAWRTQTESTEGDCWTPLACVAVQKGDDGALQVRSPFTGIAGWYVTSDGVEVFSDKRFRLLGRLDRIVKLEEKRLSLPEMEARLQLHKQVQEAGVVLLDGPRRVLGAVLILTPEGEMALAQIGKPALVAEIKTFLGRYFESTLLPRRWRIVRQMPHNERGKTSSAALAVLFADTSPER